MIQFDEQIFQMRWNTNSKNHLGVSELFGIGLKQQNGKHMQMPKVRKFFLPECENEGFLVNCGGLDVFVCGGVPLYKIVFKGKSDPLK